MPAVSKDDLIYIAGFIDGEGSIGSYNKTKDGNYYPIYLKVANTNLNIILWLQSCLGGHITKHKRALRHKQIYELKFEKKKAKEVVEKIYPFLKIKKRQAELALKLRKSVSAKNGGSKLNPVIIEQRRLLCEQLHILNKRGI